MAAEYTITLKNLTGNGLIQVARQADMAEDRLDNASMSVDRLNQNLNKTPSLVRTVGGAIAGYLTFQGIVAVGRGVFEIGTQFERLEAVMVNMVGPEEAKQAFGDLTQFADDNNVEIQELIGSYNKLNALGFKPTMNNMRQLGDLAAFQGKGIDQLSEALLDATTGEFERLKEFGIKARVEGDKVSFLYRGQTTAINNTSEAIRDYILGLGDMAGVQGTLNAIADTTGAKWIGMQNEVKLLAYEIFNSANPAIDMMIEGMTGLVEIAGEVVQWLNAGVTWMQEHETATKMITAAILGAATGYGILSVAQWIASGSAIALASSIWATTVAFLASPIGWVTVGLAGLAAGVVYLWDNFEGFRGFLYGLWESVKVIFNGITSIFMDFFGGTYDLIKGLVTFDYELVGQGIEKIGSGLIKANPIGFVATYAEDIADGFSTGYDKGVADFQADQQQDDTAGLVGGPVAGMPAPGSPSSIGAGGTNTNLKAGTAGVEGDARQARNITINIGKFQDAININTTNINQAVSKLEEEMNKAFLKVVNDVNYVGG